MKEPVVSIQDMLGTAVNATNLSPGRHAVSVVGALGAAAHNRYFDSDAGRMQAKLTAVGVAEINPRRRMAALLDRAKYGLDRAAVRPAILLFADYLRRQREYAHWCVRDGNALVFRFAALVVVEYLYDRCAQCGGGGQVAIGKIRGRDTQTKTCALCRGAGLARVDHRSRQQALSVSRESYEMHWEGRLVKAHALLQKIEDSNVGPLRAQLKRGTLPSVSK